jgi:hypothetical protein
METKCTAALQLDVVTAERNSLHEDLINHRDSKRTVDKQWRLERERCERLESELSFYQNHSAQALSDRDKVKSWPVFLELNLLLQFLHTSATWRLSVMQGGLQCRIMAAGQADESFHVTMLYLWIPLSGPACAAPA